MKYFYIFTKMNLGQRAEDARVRIDHEELRSFDYSRERFGNIFISYNN